MSAGNLAISLFLLAGFSLCSAADGGGIRRVVGSPSLRHTIVGVGGEAKLPGGLSLVDWEQIKAEYERHRHGMFPDGKGGYHSRSHYHGWLVRFDGKGVEVDPDTESWTWGLDLVSWGREGKQSLVSHLGRFAPEPFGQLQATAVNSTPRQIQFGLKFAF